MTATADADAAAADPRSLRIAHLSHQFGVGDAAVTALHDIDLAIPEGSFVCLVGPSGCGKTTLLRMIAGFDVPTVGRVEVGGRRVTAPGADRGVVFQQPTSLLPWADVRRNVELGLRLRGQPKRQRRERVDRELERVRLSGFADRAIYELSGGMQQRCQIARVLANDPDVMLMDEPLGALDVLTWEHLQEELRRIWHETHRTVVLITHSVEEAVALGSRVIVLSSRPGRIVFDEAMPFAASTEALSDLRSTEHFVDACRRVRAAIEPHV